MGGVKGALADVVDIPECSLHRHVVRHGGVAEIRITGDIYPTDPDAFPGVVGDFLDGCGRSVPSDCFVGVGDDAL
jgi:hypothetical protein